MSNKKNRSGTSQDNRVLSALQPEYVSVEERTIADLLMYARAYAQKVNYYNEANQLSKSWAAFLDFTDDEILELAQFVEDPAIFSEDSVRLEKYSKPHLALLLTFLKLLQYPKDQFAALTERNVAYFYENVLQLERQPETADQVHVIFTLAQDISEHLLKTGTLLNAGKDDTGADLHYQVMEDVVLNTAKVTAVKTIHLTKTATDLKYVHQSNDQGDTGFEKMLCVVLGNLSSLPVYTTSTGQSITVNAKYLRTDLYKRIKSKERDEISTYDADYIFDLLCFKSLNDFMTCLSLLYREINRGYAGVTYPEAQEWEAVYLILAEVHQERLARIRRAELKALHQSSGFTAMIEYAFGDPEPGNMLYKMPGKIATLAELAAANTEAARYYIENRLCMSKKDFATIMANYETALTSVAGEEVYALLETAWTKKRNYHYPEIGAGLIDGFYADTIYAADKDEGLERFAAFGAKSSAAASETINLGFAVSSPVLNLAEGSRQIELVVSCPADTIDHAAITALLKESDSLFTTWLSTAAGWQEADSVIFEHGKFIIKSAVKTYDRASCSLVCDIGSYSLTDNYTGQYIGFANGKVYEISRIDTTTNQMELTSTKLVQSAAAIQLISQLRPQNFLAELSEKLTVANQYPKTITSPAEIFSENFQGKYVVCNDGKIFNITRFISANEVEAGYCGALRQEASGFSAANRLLLNKVWETIDLEIDPNVELTGLAIAGIATVHDAVADCTFEVSDAALKIRYPEGTTANQVLTAWKSWLNVAGNDPGRYQLATEGAGSAQLAELSQELEATGAVVKRYESLEDKGIRVTYQGRPVEPAYLVINAASTTKDTASFLVSGETLTITPGLGSQTANQIAADWNLWLEKEKNAKDAQGFQIESRDAHYWEAVPVSEQALHKLDRQVKKCEVTNLYGVGIRVWYTGPQADQPQLILQENSIDLFEFTVSAEPALNIKYPSTSDTSAEDLLEAWDEWCASELNDPGNFAIEILGDGLWNLRARSEKPLKASENQIMECTIAEAGIIARYAFTEEYPNAVIEFVKNATDAGFSFSYADVTDTGHNNLKTKKLTINYPPLKGKGPEYLVRQVQSLLSKWNREYQKHGFSLIRLSDDAQWAASFPETDPYTVNFMDALNYVGAIDPNGFVVKYKPGGMANTDFSKGPQVNVVLMENDTSNFAFQLLNDYAKDIKYLYIYYPNVKSKRTVAQLLAAWNTVPGTTGAALLIDADSLSSQSKELKEFTLVSSGTGKWEITASSKIALTPEATNVTEYRDRVNYAFYEYPTSDAEGFTIYWAGPQGTTPQVTMVEREAESFAIELATSTDAMYDVTIGEALLIKYPKRADKRRLVDLLTVWQRYQDSMATKENFILGFDIVDTSLTLEKRAKAALLPTGDRVNELHTGGGNGLCISYIGHRAKPAVVLEIIRDFTDSAVGQKVLWDNGEIFTISEKRDANLVTVAAAAESIDVYDRIQLYEADALCLEALKFTLKLDDDFAAVAPLGERDLTSDPAIKILLKQTTATGDADSVAVFYDCFNALLVKRIDLKVTVAGLTDLKLRGNIAMINPENPFVPFGQTPALPSRFYFANAEICEKKLDSLQVNVNWAETKYLTAAGLPDLESYYYAYSHFGADAIGTVKNEDFEINLEFLDKRSWISLSATPQALFKSSWSFRDFSDQTYQGELFSDAATQPKDPLDWSRYYKLELANQDFLSDHYADLFAEQVRATRSIEMAQTSYDTIKQELQAREAQVKAAKLAEAEARVKGDAYYQPVIPKARELPSLPENDQDCSQLMLNAPYTPIIQDLSVDYTASARSVFGTASAATAMGVDFFRIHPFGYEVITESTTGDSVALLPQYDQEGYLFIGLGNITPPQTVSLLFQMVSGSGDASLTMPDITWSYLADNQWVAFEASEIIKDQTYGLENTGIIRFAIPEAATISNTILPGKGCWLRAAAAQNLAAVPDILDIRAQAVCVTYRDQANDPQHLATPLAAGRISELETRDAEIKRVEQLYSSFGGKVAEGSTDFYQRVSERLKHKNRALTLDDYEKLVLAQFPQIYKVKCIPQEELESFEPESKGTVVVVVILKNANSAPFFPLKPKTPTNLLEEIKAYLEDLMPPSVTVKVRNPRYEAVTYRLAVKFAAGYEQGYYLNQLNTDLKKFLSPWAYDQDAVINFGSSVYSATLINYLEQQAYVDYIANFNPMQQTIKHSASYMEVVPLFLTDENVVTTKYPDSILVSADRHVIDVITTEYYDPSAYQGIGYMKIESDFWITRPSAIFSVGIGEMEIEAWPVMRYAFSTIPVKVKVTATLAGTSKTSQLETRFSTADSQLIWDALVKAGYLDCGGNLVTTQDLYADDFYMLGSEGAFVSYLKAHLSDFTFQIAVTDFDASAGSQTEFRYQVLALETTGLETAVVNLLKEGQSFDGISQYPMIVY